MPLQTSSAGPRARLRARLREATGPLHDDLDTTFKPDQLCRAEGYGAFLVCQLAAHAPIERWVRAHCPADLAPPPVTGLLIEDLHELGRPFSQRCSPFALEPGADPLGLAWTVAGSHLGNRAILHQQEKAGANLPRRFLADGAMAGFWQRIRPLLERECSEQQAQPAIAGALQTFRHFTRIFAQARGKAAA